MEEKKENIAFNKAFGENLRKMRKEKNMSSYDLDEKSGVHYNLIGKIERGEVSPTSYTVYLLSKGLGITPDKLFQFDFTE